MTLTTIVCLCWLSVGGAGYDDDMSRASNGPFIVYALHHVDSAFMYIGKSMSGLRRPKMHGRESLLRRLAHLPLSKWIIKHRNYEIVNLETGATPSDISEGERFYIAYFRNLGVPLLNCTDGGEGSWGRKDTPAMTAKKRSVASNPSPETRQKMSEAHRNISDDTRRRMSEAARKRPPVSDETRRKMAQRMFDEQLRARMAAARRGRRHSEETKAKISAGNLRRPPPTAETRLKMSMAQRGKTLSPETRAKIAAAGRGRKQSVETIAKRQATMACKKANSGATAPNTSGET